MLRFRLRTMLIAVAMLAVPMAWVGYQWKLEQEREAMINLIEGERSNSIVVRKTDVPGNMPPKLEIVGVYLPPSLEHQRMEIRRLFPGIIFLEGEPPPKHW